MKISLNWVRDYVDIPDLPAKEISERTTLSICEVEGFEITGLSLDKVVAAKIISFTQHPNADRLRLVKVFDGTRELDIVCGASNFSAGDIVPLAPVGCELIMPDGGKLTIKKSKIRGEYSEGMLCAEDELGFSADHAGLMILPPEVKPGITLLELFPDCRDIVLEIDNKSLTHRPDLWGHYGFAREYSVMFGLQLKERPTYSGFPKVGKPSVEVEIDPKTLLQRFSALGVSNLSVQPSPTKICHRLLRVGSRGINNLVDVTNYVMLDYGQPMHGFDAEKIPGRKLNVRMASKGEKLMTLKNKEIELSESDVIIYDGKGPSALAGIVGGTDSGIQDDTREMFLEAGCWDAVQVRKTSTRVGIRTEASMRYEKSLDSQLTEFSIHKALLILQGSCPDLKTSGDFYDFQSPNQSNLLPVTLRKSKISKILGITIPDFDIERILSGLGFKLAKTTEGWIVDIPSWRGTKDISIEEDLIEEVARIYGLHNIPEKPPLFAVEKPEFNHRKQFERKVRHAAAASGFLEVFTYPMSDEGREKRMECLEYVPNRLLNPVASHLNIMRTSILPGMITACAENKKIDSNFSLFEIGAVYGQNSQKKPFEITRIFFASVSSLSGEKAFPKFKAALDRVLSLSGTPLNWKPADEVRFYEHPYRTADLNYKDKKVGRMFFLDESVAKDNDLTGTVIFADLDLDLLFELVEKRTTPRFTQPNRFPPVNFDLSIIADKTESFSFFQKMILAFDSRVESVIYTDVFHPKDMPDKKSLTVKVTFRDPDKTLETSEAEELRNKVMDGIKGHGYLLRGQ